MPERWVLGRASHRAAIGGRELVSGARWDNKNADHDSVRGLRAVGWLRLTHHITGTKCGKALPAGYHSGSASPI
eukprot:scaffold312_cov127-Isochrysis_galbana.AAC.1